MKMAAVLCAFALVLCLGLAGAVPDGGGTSAVACNPTRLTPCAGPILFGGAVPAACCAQLRAQQPCLCQYARSPNYSTYVRSPNAKRIFAVCKVPLPRC